MALTDLDLLVAAGLFAVIGIGLPFVFQSWRRRRRRARAARLLATSLVDAPRLSRAEIDRINQDAAARMVEDLKKRA